MLLWHLKDTGLESSEVAKPGLHVVGDHYYGKQSSSTMFSTVSGSCLSVCRGSSNGCCVLQGV